MHTPLMTILGISFIFVMTVSGAALTFFLKKTLTIQFNTLFLGFSSGIMVAASIWSLLLPSIEGSVAYGAFIWLPATAGILLGGIFLQLLDRLAAHTALKKYPGNPALENPDYAKKIFRLFFAVTLHNIPEGLAVGFAYGAAASSGTPAAFIVASGLAIGIGIQNFPEGVAVSIPMSGLLQNKKKAFLYGIFSGIVEPFFALPGYFLAAYIAILQPWMLAFAAGAMLFVVAEDLLPEARLPAHPHMGTWGFLTGFVIMMLLDVAFG
jgi:ZIP family zinc transporter